jgi:hypothetical protein
MSNPQENLVEKVRKSFQQLSTVATQLNEVSDQLSASISSLETSLKKLSLGVSSFVEFYSSRSEDNFHYYSEDLGYTKIGGKWGFAIRTIHGNESDEQDNIEMWSFNEAPRALRVKAVAKVPELFDQLSKEATAMIKTLSERVNEVNLLAGAVADTESLPIELTAKFRNKYIALATDTTKEGVPTTPQTPSARTSK